MTRRFDREKRALATRLGLVAVVATLALWTALAWAEPAAPTDARAGNHPGFGRLVFDFATRTAYQQVRAGDHLSLRFAADVTIVPPAHLPHNVDALNAQPGVVDLVVVASATIRVFWLGSRLVVDVYDAAGTATTPSGQAALPTQVPLETAAPNQMPLSEAPPTLALLTQAALTQAVLTQAPLAQEVPTQAAPTLAPRALAPPSGKAAIMLPTPGTATRGEPADAPEQAAVASLPLPPPPAPPAPPAGQTTSAPGQSGQRAPPAQAAPQLPDHAAVQPAPQIAVQPPDHAAVQPAPQMAVQPPGQVAAQPPNQAAAPPPASVPTETKAAADPTAVDPAASADVPAGPFAPPAGTADPPQPIGTVLALPFPTSVGVAAFRRGDTALVVFDERRPIDLAAVQDDPVFGTATVELLAEATVLRLRLPADRELAIGETQHTWHVGVVASALPARPIPMQVADGRVRLSADAVGAVVAIPDPDSGATLLVGTQRTSGQGFSTLCQTPEFSLLPTWQGIAVEPLADSLVMRAGNDGFLLTGGSQGLAISPSSTAMQAQTDASAMTRRFDLRNQPLETLVRRLRSQVLAAAMAPPRARGVLRQQAAETMIAMGLGAEAQAMLQLAATDDPATGATAAGAGLGAIAALLAGRIEDADGIEDPRLTGSDEVTLWRAVRTAEKAHGSPLAATAFAVTTPLIAVYPAALRERLLPLAFETMIEGGQAAAAARLLAHEPDNDPTLALARGMMRAANGDTDGALTIYDKLANDPDRLLHAKAAVRAVELRLSAGRIDAAHAADALDRLLYSWRGGRRELELRERIAGLREQSGDWTAALAMLHETETAFPDDLEAVHARLKGAFTRLLQNKALDRLAPLELVSMVEENSDLLPSGPAGEALEERLADRLLALDLPERAGPVLEKLMAAAPSPAGRAGFGARLAELRLHEDDAKGALAALAASAAPTASARPAVPAATAGAPPLPVPNAASVAASGGTSGTAAVATPGGTSMTVPGTTTSTVSAAVPGVAPAAVPGAVPGAAPVVAVLAAPSAAPPDAPLSALLPAPLVERRTLLMAAAQARLGDTAEAVTELAALGTAAADLARATIQEQAENWPGAEHALTDYVGKTVPPTAALDQTQQQVLVRYATAAAQAGDEATLALLRTSDGPRMPSGAFGDMFRLLTAAPVQSSTDLPRAVRETVLAHDLPRSLNALKPPTATP